MSVTGEQKTKVPGILSDSRLENLLSTGQLINSLRSKIGVATDYIKRAEPGKDVEDIYLAREALRGELEQQFREARELMPVVD